MTLNVTAQDFAFTPTSLSVRAGAAFRIAFTNRDDGVPHSVAIRNASGSPAFTGSTVSGVLSITYQVRALPAGAYTFYCTVHPTLMTGNLRVH